MGKRYPGVPATVFTFVTSCIRNYFPMKSFLNALNVTVKQSKIFLKMEKANI